MKKLYTIPLIPLRGLTVFPSVVVHFDVGREKSIAAIEQAMLEEQEVFLAAQKDSAIEDPSKDDIYTIGTICKIKQILKMNDNSIRVLVEGKVRGKITEYIDEEKDYIKVSVEEINVEIVRDEKLEAYIKYLDKEFIKLVKLTNESYLEALKAIEPLEKPEEFVDMIASYALTDEKVKQEILEILDIKTRIEKILERLKIEISIAALQKKLEGKVKNKVSKEQKEYYLREQLKAIQEELGEDETEQNQLEKYKERIDKSKLTKEGKEKLSNELLRLKNMSSSSSEANVIRTYLDWVLDIPWGKYSKESIDVVKAREVLDDEHYGLDDVKDRVIEYLAVKKFSKSQKGPILCLVGPPGVGKTSIARSIAKAINRKYSRISLGGMRDEAEIRGHRKTYVGAIPGRIAYALKESKTMNPLILFDEIDKINSDYKSDPSDALLEILDNEQNKDFRDSYLEIPMNLSRAMFIATANTLDTIPRPLLDRMEVIEVTGYTYEEKFNIAKNHLINKILDDLDIDRKLIDIKDSAIKEVIEGYTRESGVRGLERKLSSLIRKALAEILKSNKEKISINKKKVEELLGKRLFDFDKIDKLDKIGVVNGMAWTAYGGDTLPIEAMVMSGNGKLELTGKLGEVMQESAKTAYSYVRANANKFGIKDNFYKDKDIHIHAPEGAVPKDGPSAGVTMVTALVSALSGKKVRHNVAMTGEVTLTGRVLPIGGLKEKSLAAYRAGLDTIIIPKENEKDIDKIPHSIRSSLNIIPAEEVNEVLNNALIGEDNNEN
ncbi:endopeptidase La [Clostridium neonatale]|uniref:Lon protease n=1 Tax=Clostridium neonatale TaxID=137838 RepID=A0A653AQF4_9CLOT|nr:endopeptidase La [Clostridium neonatale]MBP8313102.1 endopeptidase La [Clostridium neonatale]CAG9709156.1 ATP-dependent protease La1, S16 peptidase family [Clostridium neonatale]CAI3536589.1 ATP-dependent protease La1, S16 peptidase family [Clostridium neonatale]CAI3558733.1 ATP-dependent protease La1, S16 peptidase family [Clostridium neonatale]CAI3565496.1 ATP-dependent protease La1, S16 peptidase family [Clostridium neonatale]